MKSIDKETGTMLLRIALMVLKTFTAGKTKTGLYLTAAALAVGKMYGVDIPEVDLEALPVPAEAGAIAGSLLLMVGVGHDLFKKVRTAVKGIRDEVKPKI